MKNTHLSFKILLLIVAFTSNLFSQDTLDVAPFNDDNEPNLVPTIWGDTTETGARKNLNRVYRLQREGVYIMNQTIFADFPIRIVADNKEPDKRPPILIRGSYSSGDNIKTFFTFSGSGLRHSFKNIIFNGVDLDEEYFNEWNRGLKISGDDVTLKIEGCIMNAWAGLFLEVAGNDASLFIRDSKWRNGVSAQAPPWGAQQSVFFSQHVDTVVMTNNTSFNTGGFLMDFELGAVSNYVLVEHNTFFTGLIDMIRMRDLSNAIFRSNIYYATHAYGQSEDERNSNWFDKDREYLAMFSLDTTDAALLSSIGLTESDKNVLVSHNAYYSPQKLKDWWESYGGLNTPVWMNTRTQSMFDNDDDFPHLSEFDNTEQNPNFIDTDMESWIIDEMVEYCDNVRKGQAITDRNYDRHTGTANLRFVPWPLPESLVYSNQGMLTGGHDGLPIGDLNWYPEKRLEYEEGTVGVDDITQTSRFGYYFYPNPTSGNLNLDLEIDKIGNFSFEIYDISGAKIKGLSSVGLDRGDNCITIDVSNLLTGMYFIKISDGKRNIVDKFFVE